MKSRDALCRCGSMKKYKKCCMIKTLPRFEGGHAALSTAYWLDVEQLDTSRDSLKEVVEAGAFKSSLAPKIKLWSRENWNV